MMRFLFAVLVVLVAAPLAQAAPADDLAALVKVRDALAEELARRQADAAEKGPARDYHLHFAGGADGDEMDVVLRRRAGAWAEGWVQVPAWEQGTMQEWRGFHHMNGAGCKWRPTLRFMADAAGVKATGAQLAGPMAVAFRLDETHAEMRPPGEPEGYWDRFIPTGFTTPRDQTYEVDLAVLEDAAVLEMTLEGGVNMKKKPGLKVNTKNDRVAPIEVRLRVPATRFTVVRVRTPNFSGGLHEGDGTGLAYAGGRLTGTLALTLYSDGWTPERSRTPKPIPVVMELDVRLNHHVLSGTFKATGDLGAYEGRVRGTGGPAVTGRFRSRGDLGPRVGDVVGMMIDDPRPGAEQLTKVKARPDDLAALARAANAVFHEIKALHLALQHAPLPLVDALDQTATAEPAWGEKMEAEALAAYLARLRSLVAALPDEAGDALPTPLPEDETASPGVGTAAAPVEGGVNVLPAKPDALWLHLTRWQVVGPFEQRLGLEHNTGLVPEVAAPGGPDLIQPTDYLGAVRAGAAPIAWQPFECASARLSPPWGKVGFYNRFRGQVWYAAADLASAAAREAWLALETGTQAKVWLNDRLVWSAEEPFWRYRPRGRTLVSVQLVEGVNRLLVRGHRDRRKSWVRLAISAAEPVAPPAPKPHVAVGSSDVFPEADPPLAWDIDRGINVAWRRDDLGGGARPAVAGDLVFVASNPDTLVALDAATGETRWEAKADVFEVLDEHTRSAIAGSGDESRRRAILRELVPQLGFNPFEVDRLRPSDPVTDGKRVWMHARTGVTACFDANGKRVWMNHVWLAKADLHLWRDLVVLEGDPVGAWPRAEALAAIRKDNPKAPATGIVLLDAATGEERGRWTLAGEYHGGGGSIVACGPGAVLVTSGGAIVDLAARTLAGRMDVEYPGAVPAGGQIIAAADGDYAIAALGNLLFLVSQEQTVAARFWNAAGRPAAGQLWESNYEHSGFGSFVTPAVAAGGLLFSIGPVLERGPHCPDPRLVLHAQDAATGRPVGRLKPALNHAVQHNHTPVVAGPYLFCLDPGGGSHGGLQDHGQVLVTTADANLSRVAVNLVDLGTRASPVFAGARMFLRSGKGLACVAVTDEKGRQYQEEVLARTLLKEIGARPVTASPRKVATLEDPALGPGVPVGTLVDGRTTVHWLGAGPFPAAAVEAEPPLERQVQAGDAVTLGDEQRPLEPLSHKHAYNKPPVYVAVTSLQGTGEIVPSLASVVDPQGVSGLGATGLLYTLLDNRRERIVLPTLKAKGVDQWLGGHRLAADKPLRLAAGLYPYWVRVGPAYYEVERKEILPPVDVAKAREAGALKPVGWPDEWYVVGPLPPDTAPLEREALRSIPKAIPVADRTYPAFRFPVQDRVLNLTALVGLRPGETPDVENAPPTMRIGLPSLAYAFAEIDCPADGRLYVTMAADWFSRWYLDGEVVYDTMKSGNGAPPTLLAAHPFAVRVTKGKHVLAVQVRPGSRGWSVTSLGGFAATPEAAARFRVPSKQKVEAPDFRFAPAFSEIPHPPTRDRRWIEKVRAARARLERIVRHLPGTDEAKAAEEMLKVQ